MRFLLIFSIFFPNILSVNINSIPQHKETGFNGSIPTIDIEMIRNSPGIEEESSRYILAAREIKKEMAGNSYLYKQNPESFCEPGSVHDMHEGTGQEWILDFDDQYAHGLETFLDRAESRHTRYKRRVLQQYR